MYLLFYLPSMNYMLIVIYAFLHRIPDCLPYPVSLAAETNDPPLAVSVYQ